MPRTFSYDDNRWIITFLAADELVSSGTDLENVTRDHYSGFRTEQPTLPGFIERLQSNGVKFTGNRTLNDVEEGGNVTLRNTLTGKLTTTSPDVVVFAGRRTANETLYRQLKGEDFDLYRIGDAVAPRKLDRVYYDAEMLARRL